MTATVETPSSVARLTTRQSAIAFFEDVAHGRLHSPAVLVTRASRESKPFIPVAKLAALLGDYADVWVLDAPGRFDELIPTGPDIPPLSELNTYGGATRVFPAGKWSRSRLFTTHSEEDGERVIQLIAAHIHRLSGTFSRRLAYTTGTCAAAERTPPQNEARLRELETQAEIARLRSAVNTLKARLSAEGKRPLARKLHPSLPDHRIFSSIEDEMRFRVSTLWALQTTPQQKLDQPLPEWSFGPGFASTADDLLASHPQLMGKLTRAIIRVLLDQDRNCHRLTVSGHWSAREDGASAWRAYIEQGTPSARRLHFWRIPGGGIELARVALHDDYDI